MKRKFMLLSAVLVTAALGLALGPSVCLARYPDKPIQLVIPYVPGATGDITARMLADEMEKSLNVKIIPVNKPGASATLGTDYVVRSKKDGYTLVYTGASAFVYAPIVHPEIVHYNPAKDVVPLGFHYFFPQQIAVRSDAPWKTFGELIDYAKKNPGKLRINTIGVGSSPHFMVEMIQSMTGAKFTHVPFEGGESVITGLLGGHVEVTCDGFAKFKPHFDAGKIRILITSNRIPGYNFPTSTDLGYKQKLIATWFGVYAPAGVPDEVIKVLVPAVKKAVLATKARVDHMGSLCEYKSPEELTEMTKEEVAVARQIAKNMNLVKK